jgi:tRNA G10  N-methylase Trm11
MKTHPELSREEFAALLNWFSTDSDQAGEEYEAIRQGLVRFFGFRGCFDPQSLADETINRVAIRLEKLEISQDIRKISIFYGFALNVFREYIRFETTCRVELRNDFSSDLNGNTERDEDEDLKFKCLTECLDTLEESDRNLIIDYFSREKFDKIEFRRQLAESRGITATNLHVKIHRIKRRLRKCIESCQKGK